MKAVKRWRVLKSPFHSVFSPPKRKMVYEIDKRTMVDRERGFIYFRIPKAANSTVVRSLISSRATSREAKKVLPRASALRSNEVQNLSHRFFLFTVVRNPYSRLASAYLDKIVRGKRSDKVLSFLSNPQKSDVSFLEFCRYLAAGGVHEDPHWYLQCDLIPCGVEKLHFVGRVERLESDLNEVLKRIHGEERGAQRNWTRHATGAESRLAELYCEESIRIVREVYARDFTTFDYSEAPHWL